MNLTVYFLVLCVFLNSFENTCSACGVSEKGVINVSKCPVDHKCVKVGKTGVCVKLSQRRRRHELSNGNMDDPLAQRK